MDQQKPTHCDHNSLLERFVALSGGLRDFDFEQSSVSDFLEFMAGDERFQKLIDALYQIDPYDSGLSTVFSEADLFDAIAPTRRLRTVLSMTAQPAFSLIALVLKALKTPEADALSAFTLKMATDERAEIKILDLLILHSGNRHYDGLRDELVAENPHSIYPTSSYREGSGSVVSSPDSSRVEAVMTSKTFTSIRVEESVLEPENTTLSNIFAATGRCVALVDENVETHFGAQLEAYFEKHGIPLIKLVYRAMEVDKGIQTVEKMLGDFKQLGVSRNESVLICGGGVLCDTGGLACALYHRNTPYVMLSTSIVAGIDAGPSPRTCCDGFGYKNLFGSYHTPVISITDRTFFSTLHEGWIRHGIAEIIKMASVKDFELFELLEASGNELVTTKFGTVDVEPGSAVVERSRKIISLAIRSYVEAEYGNLYETHQCRPHAFGHTWSPGFEIAAGLLHGHAVTVGMAFGGFLSYKEGWITEAEMQRLHRLIETFDLSLWHEILDDKESIWLAQVKMTEKRGGNLAAPLPKGALGRCGYLNEMPKEKLFHLLEEYKVLCGGFKRSGLGIDPHCRDVGLEDPSTVAESNLIN